MKKSNIDAFTIESDRLVLQSNTWELATETLLDSLGVLDDWKCIDFGCGPIGILNTLCRRIRRGCVIGIDSNNYYLEIARRSVPNSFCKLEVIHYNKYKAILPPRQFNLVHERFVLPHLEAPEQVLNEMKYLLKPGGFLVLQELDLQKIAFSPQLDLLVKLGSIIQATFDVLGNRKFICSLPSYLESIGVNDIQYTQFRLTLSNSHPYVRWLYMGLLATKTTLINAGVINELEYIDFFENFFVLNQTWEVTFYLKQIWGVGS